MSKQILNTIKRISIKQVFIILYALSCLLWLTFPFYSYYFGFYTAWDTMTQIDPIVSLVKHNHYWNNIMGHHPFSIHFRPILLLLAPLIAIHSSVIWISLAKSIAFLACPLILIKFSKRVLKNPLFHYLIPIIWLTHPIILRATSFNNYTSGIALPFILLSFYYAYQKRYLLTTLNLSVVFLCKENLIIIGISLGLFLYLEVNDKKKAILYSLFSLCFGLYIVFIFMPSFGSYYHHFRMGLTTHWELKVLMLPKLLAYIGFIPLLAPHTLLYILPNLSFYFLDNTEAPVRLIYHYHDHTAALSIIALLMTFKTLETKEICLSKIKKINKNTIIIYSKSLMSILILFTIINLPYISKLKYIHILIKEKPNISYKFKKMKPLISKNKVLICDETVMPYFINHKRKKILKEVWKDFLFKNKKIPNKNAIVLFNKNYTDTNTPHSKLLYIYLFEKINKGDYKQLSSPYANLILIDTDPK